MANGYIKLYRKFIQWGWYRNSVCKDLFIHLLCTASYTDFEYLGEKYPAGTLITTYKNLADDLGFSVQQIRTSVNKLLTTNEITQKTTNKNQAITVVNWGFYQFGDDSCNKQVTNKQQTNNKQITNKTDDTYYIKEIKNIRNKEYIPPIAPLKEGVQDASKEIIDYLNSKNNTHYKPNCQSTIRKITARLNEGFMVDDFKTVIDKKCDEWIGTEFEKFLRPETLFGTKFENYLNQPQPQKDNSYAGYDIDKFEEMLNKED